MYMANNDPHMCQLSVLKKIIPYLLPCQWPLSAVFEIYQSMCEHLSETSKTSVFRFTSIYQVDR